ncbi:MAG: transposase family protein, partial [Euryarchaeota archaeon]|nr:transposase family protein [Euryarchaeota archaeon]
MGAGRKFELDLRERFLLLLIYYCTYITYTLAGFLFDVDGSTVWRNINHLERLVKEYTPLPEKM